MTDAPVPRCSSGSDSLRHCRFCGLPPGTKVGPPALARCITPDCEGAKLGAETIGDWNFLNAPQAQAGETKSGNVCCYCDATLSCASCGREQPNDAGGVAQRPTTYVKTLEDLVQCLIDNDPEDLIAAGGIRVIDGWRKDAEQALAIPSTEGNSRG